METSLLLLLGLVVACAIYLVWLPQQLERSRGERRARAERLLAEMLTDEERSQLGQQGYLEVRSPNLDGRVYRIPRVRGSVGVYEAGAAVAHLCVQPLEPVPDADVVLIHKLMIEGDEREYLRTANHLRLPYRSCRD